MPNLSKLIITAAEYKVALLIPGVKVFTPQTISNLSWSDSTDNEMVYAVGTAEPIANKQNANKYSGKLTIQEGEMYRILKDAGLDSAIQINNATLSLASLVGGPGYTYTGLCINTSSIDVKAKDKESMRNLDWTAISVRLN